MPDQRRGTAARWSSGRWCPVSTGYVTRRLPRHRRDVFSIRLTHWLIHAQVAPLFAAAILLGVLFFFAHRAGRRAVNDLDFKLEHPPAAAVQVVAPPPEADVELVAP